MCASKWLHKIWFLLFTCAHNPFAGKQWSRLCAGAAAVKTVMDAWRRRSWMLYCQALPAKSCTWEVRCKAWKRLFCLYNKVDRARNISVENWGYLKNRISPIWAENPELGWSLPLGSYFRLRSPKTDCVQVTVSSQRLPLQENIW